MQATLLTADSMTFRSAKRCLDPPQEAAIEARGIGAMNYIRFPQTFT